MKKQSLAQLTLSACLLCGCTYASARVSDKKEMVPDSVFSKKEERNVLLNASDANKPREIPIGLPAGDVTVYENQLPAVYSSSLHNLSAHWRSDTGVTGISLMNPMESAISTGNIAYSILSSTQTGERKFKGLLLST